MGKAADRTVTGSALAVHQGGARHGRLCDMLLVYPRLAHNLKASQIQVRNLAILALAAFFAVSALCSVKPEWFEFVQGVPGRDKLFHFLGAGVLSVLNVVGFSSAEVRGRSSRGVLMLGAVVLLITLEELLQLAIPARTFALADLGWSYAGIAVFGLPALWLRWVPDQQRR